MLGRIACNDGALRATQGDKGQGWSAYASFQRAALSRILRKRRLQNQLLFCTRPLLRPAFGLRLWLRRCCTPPLHSFGMNALDARAPAPGHFVTFPFLNTFFVIARFLASPPPWPLQKAGMSHGTTKHILAIQPLPMKVNGESRTWVGWWGRDAARTRGQDTGGAISQ